MDANRFRQLSAVGAILLASCSVAPKRATFFVRDTVASFESCRDLAPKLQGLACHRISEGKRIVLATRVYYPSVQTDRDGFEKLTILLPASAEVGASYSVEADDVRMAYSKGSSSFPGKADCYAEATSGIVRVRSVSKSNITVEVDANFDLESTLDWPEGCQPVKISEVLHAEEMRYESLEAWEGRPAAEDSLFEEAHPGG